jgi:hypothetical protein
MERLDLLLLAIEALDLHGSEAMLWSCEQLDLQEAFPNRVALWKSRCRNPLRRTSSRGEWNLKEQDGLIKLVCSLSQRLYPMLRQLLCSSEPDELTAQRWALFQERYNDLISERMNLKRGAVRQLLDEKCGAQRRLEVIQTLALCAGLGGMQRLGASLMDGGK